MWRVTIVHGRFKAAGQEIILLKEYTAANECYTFFLTIIYPCTFSFLLLLLFIIIILLLYCQRRYLRRPACNVTYMHDYMQVIYGLRYIVYTCQSQTVTDVCDVLCFLLPFSPSFSVLSNGHFRSSQIQTADGFCFWLRWVGMERVSVSTQWIIDRIKVLFNVIELVPLLAADYIYRTV